MTNATNDTGCAARSWRLSTIGGIAVGLLGFTFGGWGLVTSVVVAGLIIGGGGAFLSRVMCPEAGEDTAPEAAAEPTPAPVAEPAPAPQPEPAVGETVAVAAEPAEEPAEAPAESLVKPSKALPGQAELAARKGTWRYEGATN